MADARVSDNRTASVRFSVERVPGSVFRFLVTWQPEFGYPMTE